MINGRLVREYFPLYTFDGLRTGLLTQDNTSRRQHYGYYRKHYHRCWG